MYYIPTNKYSISSVNNTAPVPYIDDCNDITIYVDAYDNLVVMLTEAVVVWSFTLLYLQIVAPLVW